MWFDSMIKCWRRPSFICLWPLSLPHSSPYCFHQTECFQLSSRFQTSTECRYMIKRMHLNVAYYLAIVSFQHFILSVSIIFNFFFFLVLKQALLILLVFLFWDFFFLIIELTHSFIYSSFILHRLYLCEEPDFKKKSKYVRLHRPLSQLFKPAVEHESSHWQYTNKWAWLWSNKTLFTKKQAVGYC